MGENGLNVADKVTAAVMNGETQKLYDAVVDDSRPEKSFFLHYKNHELSVQVQDEMDSDQMYLKGLFDGMRMQYSFMKSLYKQDQKGDSNGV